MSSVRSETHVPAREERSGGERSFSLLQYRHSYSITSTAQRSIAGMASSTSATRHRSVCVISGGTAGNEVLDAFTTVFDACAFVLPVSDNGGSSSEIIR